MHSVSPSQPGDIIFLSSNSTKSVSTVAQSIVRRMEAPHGHVALAVKQGIAIHAMLKGGIRTQTIRSLLEGVNGEFKVFRNITLKSNGDLLLRLEEGLWFHNRQRYNLRFFFPSRSDASFCSELAAKAYGFIGIPVSAHAPSATLPVDMLSFISNTPDWKDITEVYTNFFLTDTWNPAHDSASTFVRRLEEANQDMGIGQRHLVDRINRGAKDSGQGPSEIRPSRDYWNNVPNKKTGLVGKIYRRFFGDRNRKC